MSQPCFRSPTRHFPGGNAAFFFPINGRDRLRLLWSVCSIALSIYTQNDSCKSPAPVYKSERVAFCPNTGEMLPDAATTRKGIGWVWGRVVEIVHPVVTVRIARTSFDQCPIVPLDQGDLPAPRGADQVDLVRVLTRNLISIAFQPCSRPRLLMADDVPWKIMP